MPNWCDNELRIRGSRDKVAECLSFIGPDFDFDRVIPYPEKFRAADKAADEFKGEWKDRPKDGFNSGGYEWRCSNWGTKWEPDGVNIEPFEPVGSCASVQTTISFSTAWSPPTPIIKALSLRFGSLVFVLRYWEGRAGFKGTFRVVAGQVELDNSSEYSGSRGG